MHKIKFEGELLNGLKHGEAKEFNIFKQVVFEGIYIKGERWEGILREYKDFKLNFEEEYINGKSKGKRKGMVKEINERDGLIFECEYFNGEKNGKAKLYRKDDNRIIYKGEFLNGEKEGKWKEYYESGKLKFEGFYKNGQKNGPGKEFNEKGELIFEGEYSNGKVKKDDK